MTDERQRKQSRWYFGGISAAGAACFTHPLDLIKVMLQTQQDAKLTMIQMGVKTVRDHGILALYNGLSASVLRQLTYSTTRFGIYETVKNNMSGESSFVAKVGLASVSGAAGGFVGTPADMVNVRMQNDVKLPPNQRRNYKHAIDGLWRVLTEEGFSKLFSGATMATCRAVFMTIGQLSFYDQTKVMLLRTPYFHDNLTTHFVASLTAGAVATAMTQPIDVLKTRAMNAKPGEFTGLWHIVTYTAKLGPQGFFKGFVPAFFRLAPHTILTFLIFEQLRLHFGFLPPQS